MEDRIAKVAHPALLVMIAVIGFGFLQGARLLDLGTGPYSPEPFAIVGIAAGGVTYLYAATLSYRGRLDEAFPLFISGMAALGLRVALVLLTDGAGAVALVAQIAGGIGWALIILCWMQVFTCYRPDWTLLIIAAGYVLDTLLVPLTSALFPLARNAVFVVVLALSFVALAVCLKNNEEVARRMIGCDVPQTSIAELVSRTKRAVVGTIVFSTTCGFIVQVDIQNNLHYAQTDTTALLGVVTSVVLLLILIAFRPKKTNVDIVYPLSVAALMSVLLYRLVNGADAVWSGPLVVTLLILFFCMLWMTFTSEAHERKLPAFFLLGLAVGCAQLSIAGGRLIALSPLGLLASDNPQIAMASIIWLLGVSVAILYVIYVRFSGKNRGTARAETPDDMSGSVVTSVGLNDVSLDLLCETYHLSQRESQVVSEFSTGRSARYIAECYLLSEHTVKTHLRRAYAKMDVHSRQELLNLIERMESEVHQRT